MFGGRSHGQSESRDWLRASYVVVVEAKKRSDLAVVVPVLNEGRSFSMFLDRLHASGVSEIADVFVIDAQSQDGSTKPSELLRRGVAGILVYNGKRGLSRQLQAAYHEVLLRGYQSVVTIDGNDKDNPEHIRRIYLLLKQGFDFVQASRFVKEGKHQNTPWVRYLAIRLLHAPLLSFASGFRWTDSTQGFRGYSARLLRSPELDLLSRPFPRYQLLMQVSARAPRIGMRVREVGTVRTYPKGSYPTKIGTIESLLLLVDLISVVIRERLRAGQGLPPTQKEVGE